MLDWVVARIKAIAENADDPIVKAELDALVDDMLAEVVIEIAPPVDEEPVTE